VARLIFGDRIGRSASIRPGCSAFIPDPADDERVLLTRRSDNGRWCLPGGALDPGESATEACAREVWEETGLQVRVGRLIGVYTSPHHIIEYADGNRIQVVAFHFEAEPIGGELGLSDETTEVGYFTREEIARMDVMEPHVERIDDSFARHPNTLVR
jgi:8-oxo-dGTP pyrophosphatase MutT (NUDIX family)